MRAAAVLLAALALGSCALVWPLTEADATRRGRDDARAAIAAGDAHVLFIGRPSPAGVPADPDSGLGQRALDCEYSEENAAYVHAFNVTMRAHTR